MTLTRRQLLRSAAALGAAGALWLPSAHLVVGTPRREALIEALLARHLALWEGGNRDEIEAMRAMNPEWDFMGRTFLVLALVNLALAEPGRAERHRAVIDAIIADGLDGEATGGHQHFLLPYAGYKPWRVDPPRSLFVDGELALVLGARRFLGDSEALRALHGERLALIAERMSRGPVLSAESYPDECWIFCNTAALAALALADALDGTQRAELGRRWAKRAREKLVQPDTGMLVSSFTYDGRVLDGPEGSSIWFSAHCLQLVDPDLAVDQYLRARTRLGREVLGFGWGREWPAGLEGPLDIDSGAVVPLIEASPGSSGLALIAAAAFDDADFLDALLRSLQLAAFPTRTETGVAYAASNQVGDAVLLYALSQGPLWARAGAGREA